jgi:hypothetical protein
MTATAATIPPTTTAFFTRITYLRYLQANQLCSPDAESLPFPHRSG